MKRIKTLCFGTLLLLTLNSWSQKINYRPLTDKEYALQELKSALDNNSKNNYVDGRTVIIKDSLTAIGVAEPILFSVYGKDEIIGERPYKIFLIDNYWVINGTLPKDCIGGVFLIIIDSRNSKIIKIIHGK
jgi:hypothetical protein